MSWTQKPTLKAFGTASKCSARFFVGQSEQGESQFNRHQLKAVVLLVTLAKRKDVISVRPKLLNDKLPSFEFYVP